MISILDSGRRTATYKLATLWVLIDYCGEHANPEHPRAELNVDIDELAKRIIALYWHQLDPIDTGNPLIQSSERAAILEAVAALRLAADAAQRRRCRSADAAQKRLPELYDKTVRKVRLILVQQPLHRLQRHGTALTSTRESCFLYDDSWMSDDVCQGDIDDRGAVITLYPAVGAGLAKLSRLLKPAIQQVWVEMVWRANGSTFKEALAIQGQLFGHHRPPLGDVGRALREEFTAECFYCKVPLETGGHVDHVLPWRANPINGVANLVLACAPCNTNKSDNLPALRHVTKALKRPKEKLEAIAALDECETDYERVVNAARNRYANEEGSQVWDSRGKFIPLDLSSPPEWFK